MAASSPSESRRLFVACDLPPGTARDIAAWQERVLRPHRDLRVAATIHVTLCFLGGVEAHCVPAVEEALADLRFGALDLDVGDLLFLPAHGPKRVVALELVDHGGALSALQAGVSHALAERHLYTPGKRPFLPHVTVARYRRPGPPFSLQNVNVPRFGVSQMVLYSSVLERAAAVHTPMAVFIAS